MADKVDLSLTGQADPSDKNYYLIPIKGLEMGKQYLGKLQWAFEDEALNNIVKNIWSNAFAIDTNVSTEIAKPKLVSTNVVRFQGYIQVTWSGVDYTNTAYDAKAFKRINVYVRNNSAASPTFIGMGFIDQIGGTFSFPASPSSYTIRITAVSATGLESSWSDEFTVSAVTDAPSLPSGLTPSWAGTDFTVSFTHDTTLPANIYLKEYLVKLVPPSPTPAKEFTLTPTAGSSQKFFLSLEVNQSAFGDAQTQFSGTITSVDIYNNKSAPVSFSNTAYVSPLATPVITASAISNGYTVSYSTQTSNVFNLISIEEVESTASTAPSTGYAVVKTDRSNPSIVSAPNNNKRWVRARLNDKANAFTSYSNIVAVTPVSPVVVDIDGPPNVASVTTSGGLDSSGTIGFNGYADISWGAVTTGGIRGYRIRYKATNSSIYSYADSPGSATSYKLTGLGAGLTYEIAVATYDEYNNTSSSYISGSNVVVGGTPYIASTVDVTGYFSAKANAGDAENTAFKFGYGVDTGKRGLVFNSSNYWYIDSNQSASLKVGGSSTNYIQWNGSSFIIDGDLRAKKGSFSGNVSIVSGASLYSGTLTGNSVNATGDTGGSLLGAGYILNSSGLTFSSATTSGITTIDATTGKLTTASAYIGSWDVNSSTLFKTTAAGTLSLNSSDATITANSTGYTSGIGVPDGNNIVMWAGASKATAPFRVYKDGSVTATAITISGYASTTDLTTGLSGKASTTDLTTGLNGKISTGNAATDVNSYTTTINGGKIRTGVIQSTTWSGTVTDGTAFSSSGMSINLDGAGSITSKFFRIDTAGNVEFKGSIASGSVITAPQINSGTITGSAINIGETGSTPAYRFSVDINGNLRATSATISGNITANALTINASNFISSTGAFSLGGGTVTYGGSGDVSLNGATLSFTGASNTIFGDDNNYGGDATVVLNQNAQLTKGRAFHYGGTTIPNSSNTSRQIYNSKTGVFNTVSFVAGDIWMTVD